MNSEHTKLLNESQPALGQLRLARTEDMTALHELVQFAYRGGKSKTPWKNEHDLVEGPRITLATLQEQFALEFNHILVVENNVSADPALVGCVKITQESEDVALLGMFAVHPDFQDQGLGKHLLQTAEQVACKDLRCHKIRMAVLSARTELLSWYKRCGYTQTGETEPFFSPESGQNAKYDDAHFVIIAKDF